MTWRHQFAVSVANETGEQAQVVVAIAGTTIDAVRRQSFLNFLPKVGINDRRCSPG
jgi:hypothetical protein